MRRSARAQSASASPLASVSVAEVTSTPCAGSSTAAASGTVGSTQWRCRPTSRVAAVDAARPRTNRRTRAACRAERALQHRAPAGDLGLAAAPRPRQRASMRSLAGRVELGRLVVEPVGQARQPRSASGSREPGEGFVEAGAASSRPVDRARGLGLQAVRSCPAPRRGHRPAGAPGRGRFRPVPRAAFGEASAPAFRGQRARPPHRLGQRLDRRLVAGDQILQAPLQPAPARCRRPPSRPPQPAPQLGRLPAAQMPGEGAVGGVEQMVALVEDVVASAAASSSARAPPGSCTSAWLATTISARRARRGSSSR